MNQLSESSNWEWWWIKKLFAAILYISHRFWRIIVLLEAQSRLQRGEGESQIEPSASHKIKNSLYIIHEHYSILMSPSCSGFLQVIELSDVTMA